MKTVTIQEAIKANEHSRVRTTICPKDDWIDVGNLANIQHGLSIGAILADWEIEARPLELYVNLYADGEHFAYDSKSEADTYANGTRIRCVKMREVVD